MLLLITCVLLYGFGSVLLWRNTQSPLNRSPTSVTSVPAFLAVFLHGYLLYRNLYAEGEAMISLGLAISTAGWISALLYLLLTWRLKILELGLIVLPITVLALITGTFLTGGGMPLARLPENVLWHIILAIPTYGLFGTAFAQACLLIIQDHQFHKGAGSRIAGLPAIETMESCLFWLIISGFTLMTINLVSGIISTMINFGQVMTFNHHVVFSIAAWICFGGLCAGRLLAGWRGKIAAKWTIAAFSLLIIAYFGTRLVNDFILVEF